jgi:peroxiredoxin
LYRAWPEGVPAPKPTDWSDEIMMGRSIPVEVRPDGTFRATDVPPGDWRMDGMVFLEQPGTERLHYVGRVAKQFHVPAEGANGGAKGAIDLGDVAAKFDTVINAGDAAPDFECVTLDGRRLRLADLRGKYVLLDFWATWCGPCKHDLPFLKTSWESLKDDGDVVILGLSLDKTDAPVRPFVAEHGYGWTHAVLGEKSKVAREYGVEYIPSVWLVLPDGKLANASVDGLAEQIARHRRAAGGVGSGSAPTTRPTTRP